MNWPVILRFAAFALFGAFGFFIGGVRARAQMFEVKAALPTKRTKREDETVLVHEGAIDGDALRLTLRTRSRIASFLVPREIVYHMSDDLLRSAAQLGKRGEVQRGPES